MLTNIDLRRVTLVDKATATERSLQFRKAFLTVDSRADISWIVNIARTEPVPHGEYDIVMETVDNRLLRGTATLHAVVPESNKDALVFKGIGKLQEL